MTGRRVWQELMGWFRVQHPNDREIALGEMALAPGGLHCAGGSHEAGVETLGAADFAESDLLDFLAADLDPVPADPAFREELREQCWSLVQDGATRPKDN